MKQEKTQLPGKQSKASYAKALSFYPLKAEEVLSAFMKVNPKKVRTRERKTREFPDKAD